MSTYQERRERGLGEDGVSYDLSENEDPKLYSKSQFLGMREDGTVTNYSNYTIADYEARLNQRLKVVADEIQRQCSGHFILYDYKGSVSTNNMSALKALKKLYGEAIEVDGDVLGINYDLLKINTADDEQYSSLETPMQYWHMQLHPDDKDWGQEVELLKQFSLIGHGKSSQDSTYSNFKEKMSINDIVLIRNGSTPIALVQVVGDFEKTPENKDTLDWFKNRRKIKVLEIAPSDIDTFPMTRGTLTVAVDKGSASYIFIHDWYKRINTLLNSFSSSVAIPVKIKMNSATPAFGVEAVAKTISSTIINIPDRSGMMIGIFGKWGRGKTYLVNNIWKNIQEQKNYHRVNFSAWKYQDTKESWAYLYENMMDQYLSVPDSDNSWKIIKAIRRYRKLWNLNLQKHKWFPILSFILIISLSITWVFFVDKILLIKALISSLGLTFLIKACMFYFNNKAKALGVLNTYLNKQSYSNYLGMQAEVENELEMLIKSWIPIANNDEKILLFVDDIDRCDIDKIIGIIDGLRIILDNPEIHKRLLIITAIDEDILKEALRLKYENFEKEMIDQTYQEYLEKIFIIGLKLNKLEHNEIEEYLEKIIPEIGIKKLSVKSEPKKIKNKEGKVESISNETAEDCSEKVLDFSNESDFELTLMEKEYLIASINRLKDATPRKIKIFYYKYLILKQLIHIRLLDKNLLSMWDIHCDEKIIMDILIQTSNKEEVGLIGNGKDPEIIEALKYCSSMVSVL